MNTQIDMSRLQDAKALKRMGLPLNTPVEQREFSRAYTKHWLELMNAHDKFTAAILVYSGDGPGGATIGKWKLVRRRLRELDEAVDSADDFIGKLCGYVKNPVFERDQDEDEANLLASFLNERAIPFLEFWQKAIVAIDEGATLTFDPDDIPLWIDDEDEEF